MGTILFLKKIKKIIMSIARVKIGFSGYTDGNLETKTQFLPIEWRPTIDNCINKLTEASGYGVLYDPITDEPNVTVLSVKYRSTENGEHE